MNKQQQKRRILGLLAVAGTLSASSVQAQTVTGVSALINTNTNTGDARVMISAQAPNNPDPSEGLIIPRIGKFPNPLTKGNPTATANGMLVYLTANATWVNNGTTFNYTPGFHYWDGAKWVRLANQNSLTTVSTGSPVSGDGTPGSPVTIIPGNVPGQSLVWDGTTWIVGTPYGKVYADTPITGDGTAANHLKLVLPNIQNGQTLVWNSTTNSWVAGNPAGSVVTAGPVTGNGTAASPVGLTPGSSAGQVLTWNGATWVAGTSPVATPQNLTISGNTLGITGGNTVTLPTAANYYDWLVNGTGQPTAAGDNSQPISHMGNVGIGTNTPNNKLQVNGGISADPGTGGYVSLSTPGTTSNAGYINFFNSNRSRIGYIGYANDRMNYVAETGGHYLQGNTTVNGTLQINNIPQGASNYSFLQYGPNGVVHYIQPGNASVGYANSAGYAPGDNLGNHTMTTTLYTQGNNIRGAGYGEVIYSDAARAGSGWSFWTGNAERMRINNNGTVNIGTAGDNRAQLVVNGTRTAYSGTGYTQQYNTLGGCSNSYSAGSKWVCAPGTTHELSIYASQAIYANGELITQGNVRLLQNSITTSDKRTKTVLGITNNEADLAALKKIDITNYTMRDTIKFHGKLHKKVIAQQLEQVYPLAVDSSTGFIPDIYAMGDIKNTTGTTYEVTIPKAHGLQKGARVRLYEGTDPIDVTVDEVKSARSFVVTLNELHDKLFVFGREVSDYRGVDYDALTTLNISATQELAKKIEALETKVGSLTAENTQLKQMAAAYAQLAEQVREMQQMLGVNTKLAGNRVGKR